MIEDSTEEKTRKSYAAKSQSDNHRPLLPPFYSHYTGQPALAGNPQLRTGGFCWSKILLPAVNVMSMSVKIQNEWFDGQLD